MKIKDIQITHLKIKKSLIRIITDTGIEGWSEAPIKSLSLNNSRIDIFSSYVDQIIKPLLIGEDPIQIDRHWETLALGKDENSYRLPPNIVGAIDIALWDLLGKETNLPVHRLMGGAARKKIPLYWSVGSGWEKTPDQMLSDVKEGWDSGYRAFKIRMDWRGWRQDYNPEKDYLIFEKVRNFLPREIYLGFDANNGYSVSTAIQQGRRFEKLGINHFEEPLPHYDLDGLKQVSDALDVAVSAGEQDGYRWWFQNLISLGNPDILQPDILNAGGPSEVKRIFEIANNLNKPVMPHSPQAGINSIASIQVYSTVQNATRPHEFSTEFSGDLNEIAELYGNHVIPENGEIKINDKPGLGIELNENLIQKFKLQYKLHHDC